MSHIRSSRVLCSGGYLPTFVPHFVGFTSPLTKVRLRHYWLELGTPLRVPICQQMEEGRIWVYLRCRIYRFGPCLQWTKLQHMPRGGGYNTEELLGEWRFERGPTTSTALLTTFTTRSFSFQGNGWFEHQLTTRRTTGFIYARSSTWEGHNSPSSPTAAGGGEAP